MNKSLIAAAIAVAFCAFPSVGLAQDQIKKEPSQGEKKPEEVPKRDQKSLDFEKAIKDLKRIEGPISIYQRKKEILVEVSEDQLGKLLMVQATLASGFGMSPYQAGDPVGAESVDAFRLDRIENQLVLVRPNLKFRWSKEDPLSIAASRSMPEAMLAGFPIEQTDPEKRLLLVNMTTFFYGDLYKLNDLVNSGTGGNYMLDREKSSVEKVNGFPSNSVVQMKLHYFSPRGADPNPLLVMLGLVGSNQQEDTRSLPIKVTYSLWFRPEDSYVPRLSDPRVGYFTQDFFSLSRFLNDNRTQRYIMRWNLQKKDPAAALSEPVKPIMWTLDPSIPKEYRPAVKEGILRWNKAFEAVGFRNALQVQEVPESDRDYDHADGRYNVVRWALTPDSAYAIALPRVDPFTGEILSASVTFDANMVYSVAMEHQKISTPAAAATRRAGEVFTRDEKRSMPADAYVWDFEKITLAREAQKALGRYGWKRMECSMGEELANQATFAYTAALATGMRVSKDEYVNKFISSVISHEIGHCLGLRHNFAGSTQFTTAQLADDALTSQFGISASVMDYNPVNVQAVLRGSGNFYTPVIGPYDEWAIHYGYAPFGAKEPAEERNRLAQIASQSGKPGLAFMTDENADDWDPYVVRFDNSKDPVAYSEKNMEAARRALRYALTSLPRPGESYAKRTEIVLRSLANCFKEGRFAARFVGGLTASRSYRGDAGERPTLSPVDSAVQRQALTLITKNCLAPGVMSLPTNIMSTLNQDMAEDAAQGWNAPMREFVAMQQQMLYSILMSADTTDRIAENSYKMAGKAGTYNLVEHFDALIGAVFAELDTDAPITALRRDLQRVAVNGLVTQAGAGLGQVNTDVRVLANAHLKNLSAKMSARLERAKGLDEISRIYLRDSKELIDRFLARSVTGK